MTNDIIQVHFYLLLGLIFLSRSSFQMKKQIKLAVLGAMLFTGANIMCEDVVLDIPEETTVVIPAEAAQEPVEVAVTETLEVPKSSEVTTTENNSDTAPVADTVVKGETFRSKAFAFAKNTLTNKWVLGTGAVVVGCYIAYKIYQVCNDNKEEAQEVLS